MRTLSKDEIDQVSGGLDVLKLGPVSITGIEAGLALRNVMGATGVAYGFGYALGSGYNAVWQATSGNSFGTDIYKASHSW